MKRTITIGGGGLAGLSLGIALRKQGWPVVLHEAGAYPRHRVCGEFISGVEHETLRALGIDDLFAPARTERTTAWFLGEKRVLQEKLPTEAIGISRHYLDGALEQRFRDLGGELQTGSRLASEAREGLVWCAGRKPARGEWIGLKCHLRGYAMASDLEMHVGRGAYAGLAKIEGDLVNVCGLFRVQKEHKGGNLFRPYLQSAGLAGLAEKIERAEHEENSFSAVAGFQMGWQEFERDHFVLGDALAMIPPFTGNGMSMAFESAESAVEPLSAYLDGRIPWAEAWRQTRGKLNWKFARRIYFAQALHPVLTSRAGQSFIAASSRGGLLPFRLLFHLLR